MSGLLPQGVGLLDFAVDAVARLTAHRGRSKVDDSRDEDDDDDDIAVLERTENDDTTTHGAVWIWSDGSMCPTPSPSPFLADAPPADVAPGDYVTLQQYVGYLRAMPHGTRVAYGGTLAFARLYFAVDVPQGGDTAPVAKRARQRHAYIRTATLVERQRLARGMSDEASRDLATGAPALFDVIDMRAPEIGAAVLADALEPLAEANATAGVCAYQSAVRLTGVMMMDVDRSLLFANTSLNPLRDDEGDAVRAALSAASLRVAAGDDSREVLALLRQRIPSGHRRSDRVRLACFAHSLFTDAEVIATVGPEIAACLGGLFAAVGDAREDARSHVSMGVTTLEFGAFMDACIHLDPAALRRFVGEHAAAGAPWRLC